MKKRGWKILLIIILPALAFGGWYALPPKSPSNKIIPKAYRRIEVGMRLKEVEAVIGLPPGDYGDNLDNNSRISSWGSFIIIDASYPVPSEDWRTPVSWIGKDYAISVFLDDGGSIVIDKQLCASRTPKPRHPLEQLRTWLDW
jgi:hypothetical protein